VVPSAGRTLRALHGTPSINYLGVRSGWHPPPPTPTEGEVCAILHERPREGGAAYHILSPRARQFLDHLGNPPAPCGHADTTMGSDAQARPSDNGLSLAE